MNNNLSYLIVLIDRSGSMANIANLASESVNKFIYQQAAQPGECILYLAEFASEYNLVYSGDIKAYTGYTLETKDTTALNDAIMKAGRDVGEHLSEMAEDARPGNVTFLIQTDGDENDSKEYPGPVNNRVSSSESPDLSHLVKDFLKQQSEVYNWNIVFLGSGLHDAEKRGVALGIGAGQSIAFTKESMGVVMDALDVEVTKSRTATREGDRTYSFNTRSSKNAGVNSFKEKPNKSTSDKGTRRTSE